jgi:hypothetical protein
MVENRAQILGALNLARGMPLKAKQRVIPAHAHAIIGNADQAAATGLNLDGDSGRLGIKRIFHQFLDDTGRAFHHFPRGDLVGDMVR